MATERIMAEGSVNSEAAPAASQAASGEIKPSIPGMSQELFDTLRQRHSLETIQKQQSRFATHEEFLADAEKEAERIRTVLKNASLPEEERLQEAEKLLRHPLSAEQRDALRKMHEVGKERSEAGVFNYTNKEIGQKIKEGREAFTKEQWKALIKSGLAGRLSPAEFVRSGFNRASFNSDPKLDRIAAGVESAGNTGNADEVFFFKKAAQVRKLDEAAEVDSDLARDLVTDLEDLQEMADDKLLPYTERLRLAEMAKAEGGSEFAMAKVTYEYYTVHSLPADPILRQELLDRRDATRAEIQNLVNQADQAGVLVDVRTRALDFYRQVKAAKRRDKWGRDKQQTIDYARSRGGYQESFWNDSAVLKQLEGRFGGVAQYIWDGIVSETYQEVNGGHLPFLNVVAEKEFRDIQELRRILRLSEKKYETSVYYGRRNYELTAENAGELPDAILGWIRDQLAELPDTDMQTTDGKLKEIRAEAEQLLGTRRSYLETEEGQDVPETHPDFLRAKAMAEAVTDSVGYEKIISWDEKIAYEGGGEVAASYAERFASNYIGHHDAIYLMPRLARILLKLRTHKEGTYWTGHPFSEEKVDLDVMRAYRQQLQEEIVEDAAMHDIFINENDFHKRSHTDKDVNPEGRDLRYSFDDNIEKLLLDTDGSGEADIISRLTKQGATVVEINEEIARHSIRVKVFRDTKERLDAEEGWTGYTKEQRKQAVRAKIFKKMQEKTDNSHIAATTKQVLAIMDAAKAQGNWDLYDKAMWKWVEDHNNYRAKEGLHVGGDAAWYPSGWDQVRMKIDRPEKVLDRKLTDEQIDAMYVKVRFATGTNFSDLLKDYKVVRALDEARFGFQLGRSYSMLEMEDAMYGGIRTRIRYKEGQKGGESVNPDRKVERVFDLVRKELKLAMDEEWEDLKKAKEDMGAEIVVLKYQKKWEEAKKKQIELDKKILGAQFLATHALRAAGFVDGELPVWDGQLKSDAVINFFANALAAYGVNVAFGEPISHNSKDMLYEIIERGRRGWQSEWNIAAQKYMVGTYPVFAHDAETGLNKATYDPITGKPKLAEAYRPDVYGENKGIEEKDRIVNPGAPSEHRSITDTRFAESTSGGLAVPEFIDEMGDTLFALNLAKLGVVSIAGLHGYIKGLDEVMAGRQQLLTSMDSVYSAKEREEAYNARRAFTGGKYAENKSGPGFANEPFHGAFKGADWLHEQYQLAQSYRMEDTADYLALMRQYRLANKDYSDFVTDWEGKIPSVVDGASVGKKKTGQDLELLRQLSYQDFDKMSKPMTDQFYNTLYGVYDYFQDYLKARKGCIQSRGGRVLRSWEEENHKALYALRREMREAIMGKKDANGKWLKKPEHGFVLRLGYAPEVASEIAMRMLEAVLLDADYLILRKNEVDSRVKDGVDILSQVLTDDEKKAGFVIPDEKYWPSLRPEIQITLKKIRRRGLLEFMREEGYELKSSGRARKILGQKIPPAVQDIMIKQNASRVKNVFNP